MTSSLIMQPDGTSVLVVQKSDALDIYVSSGTGAQMIGLDSETAWRLGRVLFVSWIRNWFGLKLWWWRRAHRPQVTE